MIKPCPMCGSHNVEVNLDNPWGEFYGHEHQDSSVTCCDCSFEIIIDSASEEYPCSCCNDLTSIAIEQWNSTEAPL